MAYDAFISYSHAADGRLAPALQSALHRLARPWYRLRALHVFRDKTSLAANPALWPAIERALGESAYFLLLASPEASRSHWVGREVGWWLEHRSADRLLVALTDGELAWDTAAHDFDWGTTTALPASLRGRFPDEPLYVDLRWARTAEKLSLRHSQFRAAILDVAATLRGRPKEDLDGEDVRQHRRNRAWAWSAATALAAAAVIAAWQAVVASRERTVAVEQRNLAQQRQAEAVRQQGIATAQRDTAQQQRREADAQRREAEAQRAQADTQRNEAVRQRGIALERYQQALGRQLASQAAFTLQARADQLPLSVLLAVEGMRRLPTVETEQALRAGLALLPRRRWKALHEGGPAVGVRFSPDGRRVVTAEGVWDAATGGQLAALRHEGRSTVLATSADGRLVARGGGAGRARVWDAVSGRPQTPELPHPAPLVGLAFSPDGRLLVTASEDHRLRVWTTADGALVTTLPADSNLTLSGSITGVAFTPDGRRLAAARRDELHVWDAATWQPLPLVIKVRSGAIRSFAVSPDGKRFATAAAQVELWGADGTRERALSLGGMTLTREGSRCALAFSPDGAYLGVAGDAGLVWHVQSEAEVARMGGAAALAFSPDGALVAIGGGDNTARVIDLHTGLEVARMAHEGPVAGVAFSPDGGSLATASDDGYLRSWEATAAPHVARIDGAFSRFGVDGRSLVTTNADAAWIWDRGTGRVTRLPAAGDARSVTISADGRRAAAVRGDTVAVWSLPAGRELARLAHRTPVDWDSVRQREEVERGRSRRAVRPEIDKMKAEGSVEIAALSPDGRWVVTTRADEVARLWDVDRGREAARTRYARQLLAAFSADGASLATASPGDGVRVWESATGRTVWQSPGDSDLTDLALDAGGRHVVGVAARGGARLWEVGRAGAVLSVPAVRHAEFSADGRYLLTHDVNTAQVWDVRSRLTIAAVACRCAIRDVRLSPDRRLLAVVADDGTLRLRPVAAGGVARDLEYPDPEGALAFSADGALLAVERIERELSEADNPGRPRVVGVARVEVVVWNPRTGQRLATIRLDGPAGSLLFSADGRFVAAGGRVWEAATGREVARVDGTIVAFSPDQALLVTAGEPTRVWRWRPDDLMATACERLPRNLTAAEWRDFLGAEPYRKTCARLP